MKTWKECKLFESSETGYFYVIPYESPTEHDFNFTCPDGHKYKVIASNNPSVEILQLPDNFNRDLDKNRKAGKEINIIFVEYDVYSNFSDSYEEFLIINKNNTINIKFKE